MACPVGTCHKVRDETVPKLFTLPAVVCFARVWSGLVFASLGTADFTARTASPIGNIIFIKPGMDSMTESVRHSEREALAMPPSLCAETSWVDRVPWGLSVPPLKIHMLEIAPQGGSVRRQGPSSDSEVMRSSPSW